MRYLAGFRFYIERVPCGNYGLAAGLRGRTLSSRKQGSLITASCEAFGLASLARNPVRHSRDNHLEDRCQ
jgi:hypothetical protein